MSEVSAVLFTKDHAKAARFYREALGFTRTAGDHVHTILTRSGFELVLHEITPRERDASSEDGASARREGAPLRLTFPVDSIDATRLVAAELGGQIDDEPPAWAPEDSRFWLGHDTDGNVFMLIERAL